MVLGGDDGVVGGNGNVMGVACRLHTGYANDDHDFMDYGGVGWESRHT